MEDDDIEAVIRGYLSKKTPDGYYVIPAKPEARKLVEKYRGISLEETGILIIVKTRSRSIAEKILRKLYSAGLLGEY